jgi:hypothetical protein
MMFRRAIAVRCRSRERNGRAGNGKDERNVRYVFAMYAEGGCLRTRVPKCEGPGAPDSSNPGPQVLGTRGTRLF